MRQVIGRLAMAITATFWANIALDRPARAETTDIFSEAQAATRVIPFTAAAATSPDGRTFTLDWAAPVEAGVVEIFARTTAEPSLGGSHGRRVGRGRPTDSITLPPLPAADRWYFELRARRGAPLVIADRDLHLATAPNFRDVGGYRTKDGRWVRMGVAYRSDQLDRLDDADLAKIARLAPALVVDLRTDGERNRGPDRIPAGTKTMIANVMADAPPPATSLAALKSPLDGAAFMVTVNRQFVSLASAKDAYRRLFASLQSDDFAPAVYHCTAGKDRTGWASAVLLTALGVPRETVMADYLASNDFLTKKNTALLKAMPHDTAANMAPVMAVRTAYLSAALREADAQYGSLDKYIRDGLGLDDAAVARLRARFLVGAPTS